jgi:hypothetical protein
MSISLYVHLIPQTTALISETLKLSLKDKASINDLRLAILEKLQKTNDGNKVYTIKMLTVQPDSAQSLPLNRFVATYFETDSDVFCHLDVTVDTKKHVKPLEVRDKKALTQIVTDDKYVTLAKYSYYESGSKWVKVLLDFKQIKSHPADKITCDFKPRSFTMRIMDFKGQNYQFQVPKLQCYIKPEECSWSLKSDNVQITLRKAKDDDNWWSLFRSKAIGEVESD